MAMLTVPLPRIPCLTCNNFVFSVIDIFLAMRIFVITYEDYRLRPNTCDAPKCLLPDSLSVNSSTLRTASPPSPFAQHKHARRPRPFLPPPERYPPTQPAHQQASYLTTYHPAVNINVRMRLRGESTRTQRYTPKRHPRGRAAKRASRPAP